jgi:D-amino peptidase
MKVLISADMEGVTGVTFPEDVEYGATRWESARHLLMSDVNAAVDGFFRAGATEVVVNDAHSTKRNLLLEDLDVRATAIIGGHKPLGMLEGIRDADVTAFLGYHTSAGQQGILSHTYLGETIVEVLLNGVDVSEGRMNSLLAGELGVPVVLVTGDDLTCDEAKEWAPLAQLVAVKTCIDRYTARCLPPSVTATMISNAAAESLKTTIAVEPAKGTFTYTVTFDATHPVVACTAIPGVEASGERTVTFTLGTMLEAVRCFKAVCVLASASTEPHYG